VGLHLEGSMGKPRPKQSEEKPSGEAFTRLNGPFDPRKNHINLPTLGHVSNRMTVNCVSQTHEPCGRALEAVVQTVATSPTPYVAKA